jgi:hypothetical protein
MTAKQQPVKLTTTVLLPLYVLSVALWFENILNCEVVLTHPQPVRKFFAHRAAEMEIT